MKHTHNSHAWCMLQTVLRCHASQFHWRGRKSNNTIFVLLYHLRFRFGLRLALARSERLYQSTKNEESVERWLLANQLVNYYVLAVLVAAFALSWTSSAAYARVLVSTYLRMPLPVFFGLLVLGTAVYIFRSLVLGRPHEPFYYVAALTYAWVVCDRLPYVPCH